MLSTVALLNGIIAESFLEQVEVVLWIEWLRETVNGKQKKAETGLFFVFKKNNVESWDI